MKEELLHYIWQIKTLLHKTLTTTDGKKIEVIKTGTHNNDSGPDFFNARIVLDGTIWAGNIEMHINSSDWIKHKHQYDKAYNNVILHVVFNNDLELNIPTLELKNILKPELIQTYQSLLSSKQKIPCQTQLRLPEEFIINQFIQRLAIERLEEKCITLEKQLQLYKNSWEKLLYVTMAKYFGMQVNAEPFYLMANYIPDKLFAKHKHNEAQIDSLIFGVSGFLPVISEDNYTKLLNQEFKFLQSKYHLPKIDKSTWKFSKTRPANFPTVRLAQFSSLVSHSVHLFSKLMDAKTIKDVNTMLAVKINPKLNLNTIHPVNHIKITHPGTQFIQHLIINAIVPIKFLYGKKTLNENHCDTALQWMEEIKPEINSTVSFWKKNGLTAQNALQSQAMLNLTKNYCQAHRCLTCVIGNHILQQHA
ncbi:MAG: DUF2851 family protein [Bacteroidia bacterium]|nr:DUF2851 family protein [Bacteroidia bacterium]